jgi:transposase-like protein
MKAFCAKWGTLCPAAVECLTSDLEHRTTYLRFPKEHWARIRHSNLIERTFGETPRRVKVIGRLPGERSFRPLPVAAPTTRPRPPTPGTFLEMSLEPPVAPCRRASPKGD